MYHYWICHCILACTAFEIGLINAIKQESAILCSQCSSGIYLLRMIVEGGQLSCSILHFRVQTSTCTVWPCINADIRERTCFWRNATESWPRMIAFFKPISKAVQDIMNCILQGNNLSGERFCMFMVWNRIYLDGPCTDKYISRFVLCSDQVYTRTYCIYIQVCVHTCLDLVHTMYISSTYI